jgi:hypothetical protein
MPINMKRAYGGGALPKLAPMASHGPYFAPVRASYTGTTTDELVVDADGRYLFAGAAAVEQGNANSIPRITRIIIDGATIFEGSIHAFGAPHPSSSSTTSFKINGPSFLVESNIKIYVSGNGTSSALAAYLYPIE